MVEGVAAAGVTGRRRYRTAQEEGRSASAVRLVAGRSGCTGLRERTARIDFEFDGSVCIGIVGGEAEIVELGSSRGGTVRVQARWYTAPGTIAAEAAAAAAEERRSRTASSCSAGKEQNSDAATGSSYTPAAAGAQDGERASASDAANSSTATPNTMGRYTVSVAAGLAGASQAAAVVVAADNTPDHSSDAGYTAEAVAATNTHFRSQ